MLKKIPSSFERLSGARTKLPEATEYDYFKWLVGKISKNAEYPVNLQDLKYFYPLVVKALKEKKVIEEEEIAISLPAETYFEDKLSGFTFSNSIVELIEKETGVKAEVLPQGVIALQKIYAEGHLKEEKTLVIDGGFNTVNTAIVDEEGDILYTKTYYNEFGIRDLLENYFKPELKRKYPETTSNLQKLKEIFLTEEIDAGLQVIDIRSEKQRALDSFLDAVFRRIIRDIERAGENFKQFTIIGGISYYIPEIETNKPYFIPLKDGEFYTAMGMKEFSGKTSIDFGFGDIKVAK